MSTTFNSTESLSGIETFCWANKEARISPSIQLNPYQGLKREFEYAQLADNCPSIQLNPYQGLKRRRLGAICRRSHPSIQLNPYQGLKRALAQCIQPVLVLQFNWIPIRDWNLYHGHRQANEKAFNSTESLSGIETSSLRSLSDQLTGLQFNWIPIRDWNIESAADRLGYSLQFNWIPIRDWNKQTAPEPVKTATNLQFNWIPIRDWNLTAVRDKQSRFTFNSTESLSGIETDRRTGNR